MSDDTLLVQINERLGKLLSVFHPAPAADGGEVPLGFQNLSNGGDFVFIKECNGWGWYRMADGKRVAIECNSFVGKITGLAVRLKQDATYGDSLKLIVGFAFGREKVRIQSGIDTAFSKGLLTALASGGLTKDSLIHLSVQVGEKNAVLCSVFRLDDGEMIRGDYHSIATENDAIAMAESVCQNMGLPFSKKLEPGAPKQQQQRTSQPANQPSSQPTRQQPPTGGQSRQHPPFSEQPPLEEDDVPF